MFKVLIKNYIKRNDKGRKRKRIFVRIRGVEIDSGSVVNFDVFKCIWFL